MTARNEALVVAGVTPAVVRLALQSSRGPLPNDFSVLPSATPRGLADLCAPRRHRGTVVRSLKARIPGTIWNSIDAGGLSCAYDRSRRGGLRCQARERQTLGASRRAGWTGSHSSSVERPDRPR
jgi:hypothetical protein